VSATFELEPFNPRSDLAGLGLLAYGSLTWLRAGFSDNLGNTPRFNARQGRIEVEARYRVRIDPFSSAEALRSWLGLRAGAAFDRFDVSAQNPGNLEPIQRLSPKLALEVDQPIFSWLGASVAGAFYPFAGPGKAQESAYGAASGTGLGFSSALDFSIVRFAGADCLGLRVTFELLHFADSYRGGPFGPSVVRGGETSIAGGLAATSAL
jgi:hypothetical protein